jgi:membrane associated rhomboid family serine protease
MIFLLPIHTNIRPRRTPYCNYVLIAVNVVIFLLSSQMMKDPVTGKLIMTLRPWAESFMLTPARLHLWQFVSYAFLHGGFFHIIGNMFFLYLFGNNVNDKLGSVGYLCFYLAGAVFSGIGHTLLNNNLALGASGAVAAVTGAYFALFPRTLITVFYWLFYFIDTIEVPAIYLIGLKMILIDNVIARTTQHVAYDAHLSGYAFGIAASLFLLATRLIGHDQTDLWFMLRQWNRRRVYRDAVSDEYDPFRGRAGRKPITVKEAQKATAEMTANEKVMEIRNEVVRLISQRNLPGAAKLYVELMNTAPEQVLPERHQLDVANQLMSMGLWEQSAQAYEKFLTYYKSYQYLEQVQLMAGILYSRYLGVPAKALEYLKAAREKLTDAGQKKMCDDELAKLGD